KNIHFSYSRNIKFTVFIIKKTMFLTAKEKQITTTANPFYRSFIIFGRFDGDQVILRPQKYNGGRRTFPDIVERGKILVFLSYSFIPIPRRTIVNHWIEQYQRIRFA